MLGAVKKNMIRSRSFATGRPIDFISVLYGDLFDTITNTCFMSSLPRCVLFFPIFHFDVTKMSLTSRIEDHEVLFCVQVREEMLVDCNRFCHESFISVGVNF